jgi:hypothetical protein
MQPAVRQQTQVARRVGRAYDTCGAEGDGARAYGEVTAHHLRAAVAKMLADLGAGNG